MDKFRYISYAQEVIFARGALTQVGESVGRLGWRRILVCVNRSMQRAGHVDAIKSVLEESLVAVYPDVQPHVQDVQVNQALALAKQNNVNVVIGMGGGSPIGMAKALGHKLGLPIIGIPSTYAGSEMTPFYGITRTDENPPRKVTVRDVKVIPQLVIYDPQLTLDLPSEMTASTGINALAHCIEALYSKTLNSISTAAAIDGVRHICNSLLICYQDGKNIDARAEMLLGAHLAGLSLASVSMGLHHGLCHVLGGSANVPHGVANAIILPHAIRFNAETTAQQLIPAAEAMKASETGISPKQVVEAMAEKIYELIQNMNLPQRLRDVAVDESDLPHLARLAFENGTVQNNPKPIIDVAQLEDLFRDAW